MRGLDLPTLVIAHAWVLIAFTILVGALTQVVKGAAPRYWLYSDLSGILSLLGIYLTLTRGDQASLVLFSFTTYVTLHYRVMALLPQSSGAIFQRFSWIALSVLVVFNLFLFDYWLGASANPIRALVNAATFIVLSLCMIYAVFWSPEIENKFGKILIFFAAIAYIAVAVFRAFQIINIDPNAINYSTSFNTLSLSVLMVLGIFAHIGFIIIVFDQINRAESRIAQALVLESERRHNAEEREKESIAVADEQRRLIEVLTHEVRQPLNNASAALQSIGVELTDEKKEDQNVAIKRAQAVIDKVGMALSNALVAATILERQQKFNPVRYDPSLLIDMVVMDFNEHERSRLIVRLERAPLYISADPVLLRIALRNLLDNALRYSPPNSPVIVELRENEEDIGAEFLIRNEEPKPIDFSGTDIFARRVRGRSADIEGSGMGLYITLEIAKLHQGWVRTSHAGGERLFVLFIQD